MLKFKPKTAPIFFFEIFLTDFYWQFFYIHIQYNMFLKYQLKSAIFFMYQFQVQNRMRHSLYLLFYLRIGVLYDLVHQWGSRTCSRFCYFIDSLLNLALQCTMTMFRKTWRLPNSKQEKKKRHKLNYFDSDIFQFKIVLFTSNSLSINENNCSRHEKYCTAVQHAVVMTFVYGFQHQTRFGYPTRHRFC